MNLNHNLKEQTWKEIRQARIIDMVEISRKQGTLLLSYDGPVSVCPNCGGRISDKWTHISDPSGLACHGFLTKEVREFKEKIY